ncbi:AraC family transcriptional regulator with amidase-like domain [Roseibium hamelinense]|uniref:AraC family transcriptional regulator with amidase-like domain n=1 Tax=Roseibium hamelinense TaxID=150831 RepID=A0A562T177_9HYPH|nr:GlxA family transcriptional regulator [Roseibium hamelinense]MTI44419.1 GlxA family transcriptional regulator [Roseibium hamelinense]TWI87385.1 AraC family transcriptional regulator with amidase-like domain [Roseibium hamelinense]
MALTSDVTFLLLDDFSHIAFSCALEPLRIANLLEGSDLYRWRLASPGGQQAVCSNRSVTLVDQGLEPLPARSSLFIVSGQNIGERVTPQILSFIRRERARGTRIGAICSGAFVLAKAGLLDGRRAAIHWSFHDSFGETFPNVDLCKNVFVADEPFVTASGGTAASDLMLHLIGERHGADLAAAVADMMVYSGVRPPEASQQISVQARHGIRNPHIAEAIRLMNESAPFYLPSSEIARKIGISTRQLERLFQKHLRVSPKKFAIHQKLERARNLLLQTEQSISEISLACGYDSPSHFIRIYQKRFGVTPNNHRLC